MDQRDGRKPRVSADSSEAQVFLKGDGHFFKEGHILQVAESPQGSLVGVEGAGTDLVLLLCEADAGAVRVAAAGDGNAADPGGVLIIDGGAVGKFQLATDVAFHLRVGEGQLFGDGGNGVFC